MITPTLTLNPSDNPPKSGELTDEWRSRRRLGPFTLYAPIDRRVNGRLVRRKRSPVHYKHTFES